jgi:putative nucleotidyltransferase with HDIG domain
MTINLEEAFRERARKIGVGNSYRDNIEDMLNDIKEYHPPTYEHSIRVGLIASKIAESMHLDPKPALYGVLHDIGKTKIPIEVLGKTKGFTKEDMETMKAHTLDGFKILLDKDYTFSAWLALTHHRYQDNKYPDPMPGLPVPLSDNTKVLLSIYSRIVALADFYDALNRPNDKYQDNGLEINKRSEMMKKLNKDQEYLLKELFKEKVL